MRQHLVTAGRLAMIQIVYLKEKKPILAQVLQWFLEPKASVISSKVLQVKNKKN